MALHNGSGFSQLARSEMHLQQVLSSMPELPPSGHQPYVSKKKEAKRRQAEEARRLSELRDVTLAEIEFVTPDRPSEASKSQLDMAELEREMRAQLGLDVPTVAAKPIPVAPKRTPIRDKRKPVIAAPAPVARPVEKPEKQMIKTQLEVLLQVARPDGTEVPFYHCDTGFNKLLAEINASKKARGYGLKVLKVLSITTKEYVCCA